MRAGLRCRECGNERGLCGWWGSVKEKRVGWWGEGGSSRGEERRGSGVLVDRNIYGFFGK